jgi:signal transduction histidine kinase
MILSQTIAWICMTNLFLFAGILFFKKNNRKANNLLASIMFCLGYVHLNNIIIISKITTIYTWMHWITLACFPLIFLIGPLYLQYSSVMTGIIIQWKDKAWLHLLPFIAPVLYMLNIFLKTETEIITYYEAASKTQPFDANFVLFVATLQCVAYWIWSVTIIRQYNSNIKLKSFYNKLNLEWLSRITIILISISVIVIPVTLYLIQSDITILNITYPIITLTIYIALIYKSLNHPNSEQEKELLKKTVQENIGKDLHDELGGGLSKLVLISDKIENTEVDNIDFKKYGKALKKTTEQLVEKINLLIWSSKPENQFVDVFISKLKEMFYFTFECINIEHEFILNGNPKSALFLDYRVLKNLYPVLKEALHNSIKHASTNRIVLIINIQKEFADIIIKDDGVGFNLLKVQKRGLNNMEQRVNDFGGVLEIVTEKDQGTEIRFKNIPLEKV